MTVAEHFRDQGKSGAAADGQRHPLLPGAARDRPGRRRAAGDARLPAQRVRRAAPPAGARRARARRRPGGPGHITGLFTVLVEGDDHNEPVADAVRGILDGHVVLDRRIAEAGRYPAVDVLRSLSRTAPAVARRKRPRSSRGHARSSRCYADMADLVRLGAYRPARIRRWMRRSPWRRASRRCCARTAGSWQLCRHASPGFERHGGNRMSRDPRAGRGAPAPLALDDAPRASPTVCGVSRSRSRLPPPGAAIVAKLTPPPPDGRRRWSRHSAAGSSGRTERFARGTRPRRRTPRSKPRACAQVPQAAAAAARPAEQMLAEQQAARASHACPARSRRTWTRQVCARAADAISGKSPSLC